jgi:hypothetical protein
MDLSDPILNHNQDKQYHYKQESLEIGVHSERTSIARIPIAVIIQPIQRSAEISTEVKKPPKRLSIGGFCFI